MPVSYTHLDVYKRQAEKGFNDDRAANKIRYDRSRRLRNGGDDSGQEVFDDHPSFRQTRKSGRFDMKRLVLPLDHGAHRAHKGASPDEGYGDDGKHHDDGLVEHRATPNGKKRYGGKPPELRREHQDEKESDNELGCSHNSKRKRCLLYTSFQIGEDSRCRSF